MRTVPSDFSSHSIQTDTQAERISREFEASEAQAKAEFQKAAEAASQEKKESKAKGKKALHHLEANSDNPVFVGNALAVIALSGALGFGAYRKYAAGEFTWKVAGAWAGIVGLFAVGDYYMSQ